MKKSKLLFPAVAVALFLATMVGCTKTELPEGKNSNGRISTENIGPLLPGGLFGFGYPAFEDGSQGLTTPEAFITRFATAKHNPYWFDYWAAAGRDVRTLNPRGMYFKHVNLRTLDDTQRGPDGSKIEGRPDYDWIHANHPEWVIKDATGNPIRPWLPTEEALDFANDNYLNWVVNTWMPQQLFDRYDLAAPVIYLQHDNGDFQGWDIDCGPGNPACNQYTTDAGMQDAWVKMINKVKQRWPQVKMIISTGPKTYLAQGTQMDAFKKVLGAADGYYGESLTDRFTYWNTASGNEKRTALKTTLSLGQWLAANGKVFFTMEGQEQDGRLTEEDTEYSFAFFNLFRKTGSPQFYGQLTKVDEFGNWIPEEYPEMFLSLGTPTEAATQTSPNVYRRNFTRAIAYVNLSNQQITINLPRRMKNSRGGQETRITLDAFDGVTMYNI